jgi:hypothetical protein
MCEIIGHQNSKGATEKKLRRKFADQRADPLLANANTENRIAKAKALPEEKRSVKVKFSVLILFSPRVRRVTRGQQKLEGVGAPLVKKKSVWLLFFSFTKCGG